MELATNYTSKLEFVDFGASPLAKTARVIFHVNIYEGEAFTAIDKVVTVLFNDSALSVTVRKDSLKGKASMDNKKVVEYEVSGLFSGVSFTSDSDFAYIRDTYVIPALS